MPADALLPAEVRPQRHCSCGRPVPKGPLIQGYGVKCARDRGLVPHRARVPRPRGEAVDGPTLLDLINEGDTMPLIETYRKLPIAVDTMLWDGSPRRLAEIREWTADTFTPEGGPVFHIPTVYVGIAEVWNSEEQCWVACPVGHRIVRGVLGEFYPVSPEAMARTYERVAG